MKIRNMKIRNNRLFSEIRPSELVSTVQMAYLLPLGPLKRKVYQFQESFIIFFPREFLIFVDYGLAQCPFVNANILF